MFCRLNSPQVLDLPSRCGSCWEGTAAPFDFWPRESDSGHRRPVLIPHEQTAVGRVWLRNSDVPFTPYLWISFLNKALNVPKGSATLILSTGKSFSLGSENNEARAGRSCLCRKGTPESMAAQVEWQSATPAPDFSGSISLTSDCPASRNKGQLSWIWQQYPGAVPEGTLPQRLCLCGARMSREGGVPSCVLL